MRAPGGRRVGVRPPGALTLTPSRRPPGALALIRRSPGALTSTVRTFFDPNMLPYLSACRCPPLPLSWCFDTVGAKVAHTYKPCRVAHPLVPSVREATDGPESYQSSRVGWYLDW